jgi:hypothetical protein
MGQLQCIKSLLPSLTLTATRQLRHQKTKAQEGEDSSRPAYISPNSSLWTEGQPPLSLGLPPREMNMAQIPFQPRKCNQRAVSPSREGARALPHGMPQAQECVTS